MTVNTVVKKLIYKLEKDCITCGQGILREDKELCMLGLNGVALFPSMKSKNTGKIIMRQLWKIPLKINGFNWKHGVSFLVVNKEYTGDLKLTWKLLPWKRKSGKVPGMTKA